VRHVGVRRQSQYDVIEWYWADEVDKEPRSEVVSCNCYRLHDDVFDELVRYDTYTQNTGPSTFPYRNPSELAEMSLDHLRQAIEIIVITSRNLR